MQVTFRFARESDTALILQFIRELADYEKMLDQVTATEETLKDWLFRRKTAEVFFAVVDGVEVGYALYFHNFSTFLGKAGIYIEDVYVRPEYRGLGYGKAIFRKLAQITAERGCGRLEWCCLDWNRPSIDFYESMGAKPMREWIVFRLAGGALADLANQ